MKTKGDEIKEAKSGTKTRKEDNSFIPTLAPPPKPVESRRIKIQQTQKQDNVIFDDFVR